MGILDLEPNSYIPPAEELSSVRKSIVRRTFGFVVCIIVYLFLTYLFGSLGANIPPNRAAFFVILPAIPGIVAFHVFGGVLAYLIFATLASIFTWWILGKSKWVAIVIAGLIGAANGFLASHYSWAFGP